MIIRKKEEEDEGKEEGEDLFSSSSKFLVNTLRLDMIGEDLSVVEISI